MINIYTLSTNSTMSEEEIQNVYQRIHNSLVQLRRSKEFQYIINEVIIEGVMKYCLENRCKTTDPEQLKALDAQMNAVSLLNDCLKQLDYMIDTTGVE